MNEEPTVGIEFGGIHTVPITKRNGRGGYGYYVGSYIVVRKGPFAAERAKRRSPLREPLYATLVTDEAELGFVPSSRESVFFVEEAPFDE